MSLRLTVLRVRYRNCLLNNNTRRKSLFYCAYCFVSYKQISSPLHHHRNCMEDGVENVPFDIFLCCPIWTGRLRGENEDVDDVEDYRSRQPSEPALWDFLSTKFPAVKGLFHLMCMKNIKRQVLKSGILWKIIDKKLAVIIWCEFEINMKNSKVKRCVLSFIWESFLVILMKCFTKVYVTLV